MRKRPSYSIRDHSLAVTFLLLLFFASPLNRLWANPSLPWFLPYLIWAGGILLMLVPRLGRRNRPR